MSKEIKEYRRRTSGQQKTIKKNSKSEKHSKILHIFWRQTILSVSILAIMVGIKTIDPDKSSKFSAYIQNAFTRPVNTENMHPIIKNIFKTSKKAFTKEGINHETSDNQQKNIQ